MKPWRCDPYLWVHLAGLATVPLWIDLCLLGLAVGEPTLPGLELGFIVTLGALPLLVMQLWRPFYIFSLPGLALRPRALHDDQRRLLTQFRRWRVRLGALLVPIPLVWALITLYPLAFLARDITPFGDWSRFGGLAIAALGFLMANLFFQVPVAVLLVLAAPDRRWQSVVPYPTERVAADFSWLGLPMGKILPAIAPPTSNPQAHPKVRVAPRRAENSSLAEFAGVIEAQDARAISEVLPELAHTANPAKKPAVEVYDPGDAVAPHDQGHREPPSPLVALEQPAPEAVSIAPGASSTPDADLLSHPSPPSLSEDISQQPDRSDSLSQPHPEVDDLEGRVLARDHASKHQAPVDDSLTALASQPGSRADGSRVPINSVSKKGQALRMAGEI